MLQTDTLNGVMLKCLFEHYNVKDNSVFAELGIIMIVCIISDVLWTMSGNCFWQIDNMGIMRYIDKWSSEYRHY